MKKVVLIIVLLVLVLFCLIAIGVGGFFGYRYWQHRKAAEVSSFATQSAEPPSVQQPTESAAPSSTEPESSQPSEMPPAESAAPEQSPTDTEAQAPAEPAPVPAPQHQSPARPHPRPTPVAAPPQETAASPAPAAAAAPASETASPSPSATSQAPSAAEGETAAPAPTAAVKEKIPKGTLGLIFEATIDQGNVAIRVDNDLVAKQDFTASSDHRFRLTKNLLLDPGQHQVWVKVKLPDGKKYEKDWGAMVVEHGITVWKAEMTRFPKELNVKPIPVKN